MLRVYLDCRLTLVGSFNPGSIYFDKHLYQTKVLLSTHNIGICNDCLLPSCNLLRIMCLPFQSSMQFL